MLGRHGQEVHGDPIPEVPQDTEVRFEKTMSLDWGYVLTFFIFAGKEMGM